MFASRITKDVEAHDGDTLVTVTIQKLSGRSLRKAQEAAQAAALLSMRAASKDMLQVWNSKEVEAAADKLAEQRKREAADPKARAKARYAAYDRDAILLAGIVRWTANKPVAEGLEDLDEETSQKLHEAILDLSLPPLDPVEAEAQLAKG